MKTSRRLRGVSLYEPLIRRMPAARHQERGNRRRRPSAIVDPHGVPLVAKARMLPRSRPAKARPAFGPLWRYVKRTAGIGEPMRFPATAITMAISFPHKTAESGGLCAAPCAKHRPPTPSRPPPEAAPPPPHCHILPPASAPFRRRCPSRPRPPPLPAAAAQLPHGTRPAPHSSAP